MPLSTVTVFLNCKNAITNNRRLRKQAAVLLYKTKNRGKIPEKFPKNLLTRRHTYDKMVLHTMGSVGLWLHLPMWTS